MHVLPSTLKRAVSVLTLTALLLFAVAIYPVAASYPCATAKNAIPKFMQSGYALLATGDLPKDAAMIIMVNPNTGDWIILGMDNKQMVCQLLQGHMLQFFKTLGI